MSDHTPGPWKWVEKEYLMWRKISLAGEDDRVILTFGIDDSCTMEMVGEEPNEADARLIAAAPELLAAAKDVITRWDSPLWRMEEHTAEFINRLREVVAKCEVLTITPPEPYVKPKRYVVKSMQELDPSSHSVSGFCVWSTRGGVGAYSIPTREAAERIAAIYEETMP